VKLRLHWSDLSWSCVIILVPRGILFPDFFSAGK
jgi:hypothetical protein